MALVLCVVVLWRPSQPEELLETRSLGGMVPLVRPTKHYRPGQTFFHTYPDSNRFTSSDTWRPPESFGSPIYRLGESRPGWIEQSLAVDHAPGANRILLLVKTGALTVWERMPMHLLTTFTQFPNFAIYSDSADSIAGYEVVDVLANVSQSLLVNSEQFAPYRDIRKLRSKHNYLSAKESGVSGGWHLDKFKNLKIFQHAYKTSPDFDWYVMIDDDTIVFADNLSRYLATMNPETSYYLGSAVAGLEYIFAHGGSGIVLSHGAMAKAFGNPQTDQWVDEYTLRAERECCGDYMVSMYLKETVGISLDFDESGGRFQGEPIWALPASANNWCQEIMTLHHQGPRDFELMWEYQQLRQDRSKSILYSDLYNDFSKPYFSREPQLNWDNGAKDSEFSWSKDYDSGGGIAPSQETIGSAPYSSLDKCREECEARSDCLMYRYDPFLRYCGTSSSTVALGRPVISYDDESYHERCKRVGLECPERDTDNTSQQMTSGWYINRIIEMRKQLHCDALYRNSEADGHINGIRDQVEGWWNRAKARYPDSYPDPLKHY